MQPQLIAGRYQVLRSIGRGGMGTVWLCRDEVLGREVAVKQIGALPGESANETKRAMREARSAAALNHPNAVAIFDVVTDDERPWLIMEYVEGQTLADEIAHDGHLPPHRVADIGAQLAGALARAHERRIVHRDIKPGNVLIDKAGRPKISDFGIARRLGDDQLTQTGFVTGTPGYLSPELARGGDPDSASDVWALGATLYAAVEGQPPYEPRSNPIAQLMAIATERPRLTTRAGALGPAIDAMMHEDPSRRWDMATSAQRLRAIASGDATAVMPQVWPPVTGVIAAPPIHPTQRLETAPSVEPTQGLEAAPSVEPTQRLEPGPTVEPTQRLEAAPSVAGAAVVGRPGVAGQHDLRGGAPVPAPDQGKSGRPWLPLMVIALLVAVLGAAYSLSPLGDQVGTTAGRGSTASTSTPASSGTTGAPETSAPPSATSPAPPSTTSSAPSTTTATPGPRAAKDLEKFVSSYYGEVTRTTDRTWDQLTARMQDAAGGREGYDGFWVTIDRVKVNQIQANASADQAVISLTFRRDDGTTSTETHRLTFVADGQGYLIDSDKRLG